jgi:hypothetical protein
MSTINAVGNGLRTPPLINGVTPSWANIIVNIGGVPVIGITGISYEDKQTIENVYGAGQTPVARGYGKIEPSASITLLRDEIEALRKASPTGRLQDLAPFNIMVSFIPIGGSVMANHNIKSCQFTNDGMEAKEGDTKFEKQLELVVGSIDW